MTTTPAMRTLRNLFGDCPDVLRMLDIRELDLAELTDAKVAEGFRTRKVYPEPVNLYATGRTGAGKSTLGNKFLEGSPLSSTGYQDCTSVVQFFRLASNLVYFDLPGSGSADALENVNRSALLMPQLVEPDEDLYAGDSLPLIDYNDYLATGRLPDKSDEIRIPLVEWEGAASRERSAPDVILYVIAPHGLWLKPDRKYLIDLLNVRKRLGEAPKIIFALNLFRTPEGSFRSTPQNIADVRSGIMTAWERVFPGEAPIVLEVDMLTGRGLQDLAESMCRLLPPNKLGNMGQVLTSELKAAAKAERSRRYRKLLVRLAARLATFRVDATAGRVDLLGEVFAAICGYGVSVFHEEQVVLEAQEQAVRSIADMAASTAREARAEAVTVNVNEIEHREEEEERVVGVVPEYEEEEYSETVPTVVEEEVRRSKSAAARTMIGTAEILTHAVVAPIGMLQRFFGTGRTINEEVRDSFRDSYTYAERQVRVVDREVTRLRQRLTGFRQQKEWITRMVPQVVTREQEVGKVYREGGAHVAEEVLSLGLAIESLPPGTDLASGFASTLVSTRASVRMRLAGLANRIDEAAAEPDPANGERLLLEMLNAAVLS
jgi:hypothetical protein